MYGLALRGVLVDKKCPSCGEDDESILHMLVRCRDAKMTWRLSPLRLDFDPSSTSSFGGWVDELTSRVKEERWWSLFWAIVWGIWLARNAWVFEAKKLEPPRIIQRAMNIINEYEVANTRNTGSHMSVAGHRSWSPPENSWYKINVDAAMLADGWIGCGAILRDKDGDPLMVTCTRIRGSDNVELAEALAARYGLVTALEAGFFKIVLESDCLSLVNHFQKRHSDCSPFGLVIQDVLTLTSQCISFQTSHVRREGNKVAHELASRSLSFGVGSVWLEETPGHIQDLVMRDISQINE